VAAKSIAEAAHFIFIVIALVLNFKQKYYEKGVLIKTRDILKEDEEQKKLENTDSAREAQKKEIESDFVGKLNAWRKFLEHNLNYPDRAVKSNIQGDVIIRFVIDTEGNVTDPEIFRSVEWSLDEEALRIIKKAKRWTPAVQKGKVVKSYKMQPIYFRLQ